MAISLAEFIEQAERCGAVEPGRLQARLQEAPCDDVEAFAKDAVRQGLLSRYQASLLYQGKHQSLVLGNYLLIDKLGQGGMGLVFQARHLRMDRLVALKVLPPSSTRSPDAVKRFQREAKAAAKLSHCNIVAAYDADEANGTHFLVMEYVAGADLGTLIRQRGRLPVAQAVDYVLQAARGLQYAHEQGVTHRDIKPSNLLLNEQGLLKVLDMGLARLHGETLGPGQDELTHTGAVMGTIDYMAPEQAEDLKQADARSDIYSLGCTLYYLLTARPLFDGDTFVKKIIAHRNAPIPPLREQLPDIPPEIEAVYQRMVAKRPEDRFASMAEVVAALTPYCCDSESSCDLANWRPAGPHATLSSFALEAAHGSRPLDAGPHAVPRSPSQESPQRASPTQMAPTLAELTPSPDPLDTRWQETLAQELAQSTLDLPQAAFTRTMAPDVAPRSNVWLQPSLVQALRQPRTAVALSIGAGLILSLLIWIAWSSRSPAPVQIVVVPTPPTDQRSIDDDWRGDAPAAASQAVERQPVVPDVVASAEVASAEVAPAYGSSVPPPVAPRGIGNPAPGATATLDPRGTEPRGTEPRGMGPRVLLVFPSPGAQDELEPWIRALRGRSRLVWASGDVKTGTEAVAAAVASAGEGETVAVDAAAGGSLADVSIDDFDMLVLCSGGAAAFEHDSPQTQALTKLLKAADAARKPIAGVGDAAVALARARLLEDREATTLPPRRGDLENHGARFIAGGMVRAEHVLTGRDAQMIPEVVDELLFPSHSRPGQPPPPPPDDRRPNDPRLDGSLPGGRPFGGNLGPNGNPGPNGGAGPGDSRRPVGGNPPRGGNRPPPDSPR